MRQQRPLSYFAVMGVLVICSMSSVASPVNSDEIDGVNNRKLLGSSVVTSVSVIMDHPNGTKTYITDGEPGERPPVVGSPGTLLAPDRYEFYSFGKDGELVKKLMTLDQIQSDSTSIIRHFLQLFVRQGLIAGGDELSSHDIESQPTSFDQQPLVEAGEPEGVNKVLESVQNVLKSELHTSQVPDHIDVPPVADGSWFVLLPGFLNPESDLKDTSPWTSQPGSTTQPSTTHPPGTTPQPITTSAPTTTPAYRVTTGRQPPTSPHPKPQRPDLGTTVSLRPPTPSTTVKYSAHYTTPPPNFKNKPAAGVKKPTGPLIKPQQGVKLTTRPVPRPTNVTANHTTINNYKNTVVVNSTATPTTVKGTTERTKPSGIPTITHYLPIQSSIGPSDAVKTPKPPVPIKQTSTKTTPKPEMKPTKPYVKPALSNGTLAQPYNNATRKNPPSATQKQPVTEKLVQTQKPPSVVEGDMISVSVSTQSGPPSTLKITAATVQPTTARSTPTTSRLTQTTPRSTQATPRPTMTTPRPTMTTPRSTTPRLTSTTRSSITYKPPVTTSQLNKTKLTTKPAPALNKKPEEIQPNPVITLSSVATHKPVLVMTLRPTTSPPSRINATLTSRPSNASTSLPPVSTPHTRPQPTTTIGTTRPPPTTTSGTTNVDFATTLSNELEQTPLKLAIALKDSERNVFEQIPLFSTTMRENFTMLPTTVTTTEGTDSTKWEKIITDIQEPSKKETGGMSSVTEPGTTITTAGSTFTATETTTIPYKLFIINNSEPQTLKTTLMPSTDKQSLDLETIISTIADQITTRSDAPTTTAIPETPLTTSSSTEFPSTTTEPPSTIFKDQVIEEGMSAVANILLNDKVIVEKNTLPDQLTSDVTLATSPVPPVADPNDSPTLREELEERNRSSTMRIDSTWQPTTMSTLITFTEITVPPATAASMMVVQTQNNVSSVMEMKETFPKREDVVPSKGKPPIKESKLNPDSDDQLENQMNGIEATTMLMEKIKLTVKEASHSNVATLPTLTSFKPPFQDPKVPGAAFKKPSYVTEGTPPPVIDLHPAPYESMGAEASTAFLAEDVRRFADLCNELAFRLWTALTSKGQISSRSLVLSPFAAMSLLAMVFLGARGSTSGQMNEILRLDDMVTFNPHQLLQNVTDSVINSRNHGIATAAFVRELYSDKGKGKILDFYKERAQQYYAGHVEEVTFSTIGDVVRRRTNLLVKRQTLGKVPEYLRGSSLNLRAPLAAFSANIFQTDCESGSMEGRDGEMYFVVRPSTRQRRLVPVPAVVWRSGFSAGYEPSLDATSVCLGQDSVVSTLLVLPGQQGQVAPGDGLARLEQRLIETSYRRGGWSRLLRSLLPRPGLELQVPRFSHRSVLNVTAALNRMGLKDLFSLKADLRGLNGGVTDLHLSDMVQVNTFSTCGEEVPGARQHIETYPSSPQKTGRENLPLPVYLDNEPLYEPRRPRYHFNGDDVVDGRPRTGRLPLAAPSTDPAPPRLRFDRPFLYIVRHNPSGIILHIGRFNPRLLP